MTGGSENNVVEYIGGPLDGTSDTLASLPKELPGERGHYLRSVRCADDGAMRYVWRQADGPEPDQTTKGDPAWPTGS